MLAMTSLGIGMADAMITGVGPMIGEPMGLSFKVFARPSLAVAFGAGYAWWQDSSVQLQGDLVLHSVNLTQKTAEDGAMAFYVGLGAQMRLAVTPKSPCIRSGLRMPLGLEYVFPVVPFSLYAEAVPVFNLGTTDQYFSGDAVFGFRYYWRARADN